MTNQFQARALQKEGDGKYIRSDFSKIFKSHEIASSQTCSWTPQQKVRAEQMNRELLDMIHTIFKHKLVPKVFLSFILESACYLYNRMAGRGLPSNHSLYELRSGSMPDLRRLRVLGSYWWYHVPKNGSGRLGDQARHSICIGCA